MTWLILGFDRAMERQLRPDAEYMVSQFRKLGSVYETSVSRVMRGLTAEEVIARHRGATRADVRRPWAFPYDVSPDLEIRCVERPRRADQWAEVCLVAYAKDVKEDRKRPAHNRWVLALIDYDEMSVSFLGWATSAELLEPPEHPGRTSPWPVGAVTKAGTPYEIHGCLWPDQLRPMEDSRMTDLDAVLAEHPGAVESARSLVAPVRPCRRHAWHANALTMIEGDPVFGVQCARCGKVRDEALSRRGKNARARGVRLSGVASKHAGIENRERMGLPEDGGSSTDWLRIQHKSGLGYPKRLDAWLRAQTTTAGQLRAVVYTETPGRGHKARRLVILDYDEFLEWFGGNKP